MLKPGKIRLKFQPDTLRLCKNKKFQLLPLLEHEEREVEGQGEGVARGEGEVEGQGEGVARGEGDGGVAGQEGGANRESHEASTL